MKKALLFALILMVLVVFFVACDSNITPPADTDPPVTDSAEHVHTWSDWIVLTKPTCELGGQEQRYCSVCYELQNKPLEATGHTEVIDQAVPPTCTETGLTEGKHCSVCRTVLVEQNTVDAAGHIPSAEATCTMAQLCLACNVELVAALGHTESEWILDKASTCTERGSRHKECTVCKDTVKTETLYLLDHVDSDWIVDRPSTCTEGGYRHKECTSCGMTTHTGTLLALGHTESEWILDKASTCTERGSRHKECTVCKDTVKTETLYLLDHVDSDWIVDRPSTCTEGGYRHKECTSCGTTTHTGTLLALGHNYVASVTPPTLMDDGYTDYVCEFCSDSYTERIVPTSLSINSSNRDWIGYTGATNEELVIPAIIQHDEIWYRVTSIGDSAFSECRITSINIPDSVTSIGDSAFSYCYALTSINLPTGLTHIDAYAFYNCVRLLSVEIPNSVTYIASDAFVGCYRLVEVINHSKLTIVAGNDRHGSIAEQAIEVHNESSKLVFTDDGLVFYPYNDNYYLVAYKGTSPELILPETYEGSNYELHNYAFYSTAITSITLPESVMSIGESAFYGCRSLTSIVIPNSVTSIGEGAFAGCSALESITLPFVGGSVKTEKDTYQYPLGYIFGTNSYYGGVATRQSYYGDSTSISTNTVYYIPQSLKTVTVTGENILRGSFFECANLTSIILSDSVKSICSSAFSGCRSLTSITIPKSVKCIERYAFYQCTSLTSITFDDQTSWYRDRPSYSGGTYTNVADAGINVTYFTSKYLSSIWYKE